MASRRAGHRGASRECAGRGGPKMGTVAEEPGRVGEALRPFLERYERVRLVLLLVWWALPAFLLASAGFFLCDAMAAKLLCLFGIPPLVGWCVWRWHRSTRRTDEWMAVVLDGVFGTKGMISAALECEKRGEEDPPGLPVKLRALLRRRAVEKLGSAEPRRLVPYPLDSWQVLSVVALVCWLIVCGIAVVEGMVRLQTASELERMDGLLAERCERLARSLEKRSSADPRLERRRRMLAERVRGLLKKIRRERDFDRRLEAVRELAELLQREKESLDAGTRRMLERLEEAARCLKRLGLEGELRKALENGDVSRASALLSEVMDRLAGGRRGGRRSLDAAAGRRFRRMLQAMGMEGAACRRGGGARAGGKPRSAAAGGNLEKGLGALRSSLHSIRERMRLSSGLAREAAGLFRGMEGMMARGGRRGGRGKTRAAPSAAHGGKAGEIAAAGGSSAAGGGADAAGGERESSSRPAGPRPRDGGRHAGAQAAMADGEHRGASEGRVLEGVEAGERFSQAASGGAAGRGAGSSGRSRSRPLPAVNLERAGADYDAATERRLKLRRKLDEYYGVVPVPFECRRMLERYYFGTSPAASWSSRRPGGAPPSSP